MRALRKMVRPSDEEFVELVQNDKFVPRVRTALMTYPDLVNITTRVSVINILPTCYDNFIHWSTNSYLLINSNNI